MTVIEAIERNRLTVAVRTDTPEKAYRAANACLRGGIQVVEITFSVPQADEVIAKLRKESGGLIGAGTVMTTVELRRALRAGASYIVSPHLDEGIVKMTKEAGAVSIPGACTPTEIHRAHRAGGDIIKLFPFVEMGGLNFLKAIRGPMPYIRFMLSGGVSLDNISEYLRAKASCILIGSAILRKNLIAAEDWESIAEIAGKFVKMLGDEGVSREKSP